MRDEREQPKESLTLKKGGLKDPHRVLMNVCFTNYRSNNIDLLFLLTIDLLYLSIIDVIYLLISGSLGNYTLLIYTVRCSN